MKIMHNPPIDARIKVEEYLAKDGKELIHFAYGSADKDERQLFVGIAYMPRNSNKGNGDPPNRYDVVGCDVKTGILEYCSRYLNYENALIQMGQLIRKITYENK